LLSTLITAWARGRGMPCSSAAALIKESRPDPANAGKAVTITLAAASAMIRGFMSVS
jgi:hypothetical protein